MGNQQGPLFDNLDNPLRKEFLSLEQIIDFFGYKEAWVKQQMAAGNLPFHSYGRDGILFYIPEVRQAILDGRLAPITRKKVRYDKTQATGQRNSVRSSAHVQRPQTLQELRLSRGSQPMD